MATLKLLANPTFKTKVGIPVPGGEPTPVEFEFKHRTREAFAEFSDSLPSVSQEIVDQAVTQEGKKALRDALIELDVDYVMAVANSWEFTDAFNKDNVRVMLQNYHGSAGAIATTYTRELMQAKRGN